MRRAVPLLPALLALLVPAGAAAATDEATRVDHVRPLGANGVRIELTAPGDLTAAQVEARLGERIALVQSLHRIGPDRPLHLVFAVDTSGSMAGAPITAAIGAGQRLLDAAGTGDRVGLVTFDDRAQVVAPLSANVEAVRNALSSIQTADGTALYDGVLAATRLTGADRDARRVVVVLSDGADTGSAPALPALLDRLRAGGVEVDVVGLSASGSYTAAPLRRIARAGSGALVETASLQGLRPIVATLTQERLATPYQIDLTLPHSSARTLEISVQGAEPATVNLPAGVSGARYGFWHHHGGLVAAGLGFAAVLFGLVCLLQWAGRRPQSLDSRLSPYSAELKVEAKHGGAALLDLYDELDRRFDRTWAWRHLELLSQRAGSSGPTARIALIVAGWAIVPGLLLAVLLGPLAGLAGAALGLAAPITVLRIRAARRQRLFEGQLPELLSVWASALRAGRSFAQALDTLVDEAADPARAEFRRAQQQVRLGVPIEQALDEMAQRIGSESFELVVLTTDVQRRIGGNVAEIFDQVAETVRRRHQFSQRVKALVAMGVLSARVLLAMPFVIAGLLTLINHEYMSPLFTTTTGHWLIVIALTMMSIGALVLRRMVRPRAIA